MDDDDKGVLKGQEALAPHWPTQTILTNLSPDFFKTQISRRSAITVVGKH